MSVERVALSFESNFTRIPNAWARDKRLSRRARGLLAELMSHDVGWTITFSSLANNGTEGRDAIKATLRELEKFGYLARQQNKDADGRFGNIKYLVTEPEVRITADWKTVNGEPASGKPATKKTNLSEEQKEELPEPSKSTTAVDSSDLTRADVTSIVDCFSACLTANDVKHTVGKTWHNSARLLLDRDGNTVEQITWLIKWAMSHHFWKSNILSLPKFRAQFERLKLQARTEFEKTQAVAASTPSYWDQGPVVEYD